MKSTYLTETLFSTTVLRLDFTAITVQLTHGGACASHGNPDETCDLVELIAGYSMERQDRKGKGGGGCLIYFKGKLTVVPFSDDIDEFREVESAWIEVSIMSQKFLLGALYRPPTDFSFYGNLQNILSKIITKRKNMILMGDLNSDLLQRSNENHPGKRLKRMLYSYDLTNMIKEPTRISDTTKTLIDLIIVMMIVMMIVKFISMEFLSLGYLITN